MTRMITGLDVQPRINEIQVVAEDYKSLSKTKTNHKHEEIMRVFDQAHSKLTEFNELYSTLQVELIGRIDFDNPDEAEKEITQIDELIQEITQMIHQ